MPLNALAGVVLETWQACHDLDLDFKVEDKLLHSLSLEESQGRRDFCSTIKGNGGKQRLLPLTEALTNEI
jgi:hypothetical protein